MIQLLLGLTKEIFFLLVFVIVAALSVFPIYDIINTEYLLLNIGFGVAFLSLFRFVLFKKQVMLLNYLMPEVLLFFLNIVAFFWVVYKIQDIHFLFDNFDISFFLKSNEQMISADKIAEGYHFFKQEFLFIAVGVLVLILVFQFRIIGALLTRVKKIK